MEPSKNQIIHKCHFCDCIYLDKSSLKNHKLRNHPFETNDHQCWTCNLYFSERYLLERHYKTAIHQVRSREIEKIPPVNPWYTLPTDERYLAYIDLVDNLPNPTTRVTPKDITQLRDTPANIPLEAQEVIPDPRTKQPTPSLLSRPSINPPIDSIEDPPVHQSLSTEETHIQAANIQPKDKPTQSSVLTAEDAQLMSLISDTNSTEPSHETPPAEAASLAAQDHHSLPVLHLYEDADQDIVHLEINDWLTIDEVGTTEPTENFIPPEDFLEPGYSFLADLMDI